MNNADKPISPVFNSNGFITHESHIKDSLLIGLSKKEYYAGLALQGLLALPDKGTYGSFDEAIERICEVSVKFADELLKQLENK